MTSKFSFMASVAFVGALTGVGTANAQEAAAGATAARQNNDYGDIVVTANKREESLNKVGLTVTAISGDALAERRITSIADIAAVVPGLAFAPSNTGTPILTLRGVGFNESSLGVYPAVSVYIDQIPLAFPSLASHSAFDLQRIEALKGPQGTLFGQNSTGGAVNYVANRPTDTFEAGGDISYGRFNAIEGNAFISGPLADGIRGRIAVTGLNSDDWQKSVTRRDGNGNESYVAGRVMLDVDASDTLKLQFNVNGWRDKSQPQAQQLVGIRVQNWANCNAAGVCDYPRERQHNFYRSPVWSAGSPRAADWSTLAGDPATVTSDAGGYAGQDDPAARANWKQRNFDPFSNRRMLQAALRADWELGGGLTLTSQTSYADFKQRQAVDGDGLVQVTYDLEKNDGYIKTFNQEFRIANDATGALRWVLGANYEKSTTLDDQALRYFDNTSNDASLMYISYSGVTNKQKIENKAIFGNVEFDIGDKITLKGGIRYTDSKNKNDLCSYSIENANLDKLFNFFGTLAAFNPNNVPFTPIGPTGCYTLNFDGVPGERFKGNLKEDNVSWRVGVDFKANSDTLLYANVSRGYKAGSFPSLAASSFVALKPVSQEYVTSYEAGLKASLANRAIQLNAAGFYYDYRDKQVRGRLADPTFGGLETLVNIPKSRIWGLETEITVRPASGLTISGAVTYLNSKIKESPAAPYNYNVLGVVDDFRGDPLPFTPKWNGTVNVDYRRELSSGGTPFIGLTVTGRTKSDSQPGASRLKYLEDCKPDSSGNPVCFLMPGVSNPFGLNGYVTVDGRLGYEAPEGAWKVMVWGKNIFNQYYWTNVISSADGAARFAGRPATYGVTFGFKM